MFRTMVPIYFLIALVTIFDLIPSMLTLSLNELHSTSRLNRYNTEDKSLRSALDTIRGKRRQFSISDDRHSLSLPLHLQSSSDFSKYLMKRYPIKRQEEEVMDIPFEYGEENPLLYDYWDTSSFKIPIRKENAKNMFSQSLAKKISRLFDKSKHEKRSVKKRILVKRNNANAKEKPESEPLSKDSVVNHKKLSFQKQEKDASKVIVAKDKKQKNTSQKSPRKQLHSVPLFKDSTKAVNKSKFNKKPKNPSAIAKTSVTTNTKTMNSSKLNAVPVMKRTEALKKSANGSVSPGKPTKLSDTQVMEELKVIIDKKGKKKSISKRNVERSDDFMKRSENTEQSEAEKNEEFQKWLRDEYWKNMARVLSVRKKKRSADYTDYADSAEEGDTDLLANEAADDDTDADGDDAIVEEVDDNLLVFGKDNNNNDEENDTRVADFERNDDDYASLTPLEINEDAENKVEPISRKRKIKRSVDVYFGGIDNDNAEEEDKFNDVDFKLEKIQSDLINEALEIIKESTAKSTTNAVGSKIRHRLDAAYDLEDMRHALDDLHKTMRKIEEEPDIEHQETESSFEVLPLNAMSKKSEDCPTLNLLTSDCSAIEDVVPHGELQEAFLDACNWHEVCYSCGQMYGLLATDCDAGFLEKSRQACSDSPSCETAARLILMPLRQRRVFYKRKIPGVCRQQKCVRDFLTEITNKKR